MKDNISIWLAFVYIIITALAFILGTHVGKICTLKDIETGKLIAKTNITTTVTWEINEK